MAIQIPMVRREHAHSRPFPSPPCPRRAAGVLATPSSHAAAQLASADRSGQLAHPSKQRPAPGPHLETAARGDAVIAGERFRANMSEQAPTSNGAAMGARGAIEHMKRPRRPRADSPCSALAAAPFPAPVAPVSQPTAAIPTGQPFSSCREHLLHHQSFAPVPCPSNLIAGPLSAQRPWQTWGQSRPLQPVVLSPRESTRRRARPPPSSTLGAEVPACPVAAAKSFTPTSPAITRARSAAGDGITRPAREIAALVRTPTEERAGPLGAYRAHLVPGPLDGLDESSLIGAWAVFPSPQG